MNSLREPIRIFLFTQSLSIKGFVTTAREDFWVGLNEEQIYRGFSRAYFETIHNLYSPSMYTLLCRGATFLFSTQSKSHTAYDNLFQITVTTNLSSPNYDDFIYRNEHNLNVTKLLLLLVPISWILMENINHLHNLLLR